MAAKVAKAMKKQMKPPKKAPNYKSNRGQGKSRRNENARIGKAARKAAIGAAYAVGDVDHSRAQADSQDCFLYGLYDPSKGSRGPPPVETAQVPTVVIPYTAVTLFKTTKNPATDDTTQFINILPETGTGHSVAWHTYCDPTTDDVANANKAINVHTDHPYMHASDGSICVVACPHFVTQNFQQPDGTWKISSTKGLDPTLVKSDPPGYTPTGLNYLTSGFTCDGVVDDGTQGVYMARSSYSAAADRGHLAFGAASTCKPYPLAAYNRTLPTYEDDEGITIYVPFRCVGHKMRITVEDNPFKCQGNIFAFDNSSMNVVSTHSYPGEGGVHAAIPLVNFSPGIADQPYAKAINLPGSRAVNLKPLQQGNSYEVNWTPANVSQGLYYRENYANTAFTQKKNGDFPVQFKGVPLDAGGYPAIGAALGTDASAENVDHSITRSDLARMNPFCGFFLKGFDNESGVTLRVEVTTALEFLFIPKSSNSLMDYEFAYARNFVPEFSEVLRLPCGATCAIQGTTTTGLLNMAVHSSSRVKRGAQCALSIIKETPLLKPLKQLMGVGAPAGVIVGLKGKPRGGM